MPGQGKRYFVGPTVGRVEDHDMVGANTVAGCREQPVDRLPRLGFCLFGHASPSPTFFGREVASHPDHSVGIVSACVNEVADSAHHQPERQPDGCTGNEQVRPPQAECRAYDGTRACAEEP